MKIKTNINLWEILYEEEQLQLQFSTVFNSGFIDDIDIIKEYFIKTNPKVSEITIKKVLKQNVK